VPAPLRCIDDAALLRLLRFGLAQGASRIELQVGHPPCFTVDAEAKGLRYRQLAREDTERIAGLLFERTRVPARLHEAPGEGAQGFSFLCELPGEALFEIEATREDAGLALSLEIIRPLTDPSEIALLEI
jgi:hypothetical protein